MFKRLTGPYRHLPPKISTARVDSAMTQGAWAEIQSPGRGGYRAVSLITLRRPDGAVLDSWTIQGNVRHAHKFVVAYNRQLAAMRR